MVKLKNYYAKFITLSFKRPQPESKPTITIKGETWTPEPLGLEDTLKLIMLLAPTIALVEEAWPDMRRALASTSGDRPAILSAVFQSLSEKMEPASITQAFVILLGKQDQPEWFRGVRAVELIRALPVLDEVNDFWSMIEAGKKLGLRVNYRQ